MSPDEELDPEVVVLDIGETEVEKGLLDLGGGEFGE